MLLGLLIVPVVSVLTTTPDKALVDDAFSCYEETVVVSARESLGGNGKA